MILGKFDHATNFPYLDIGRWRLSGMSNISIRCVTIFNEHYYKWTVGVMDKNRDYKQMHFNLYAEVANYVGRLQNGKAT